MKDGRRIWIIFFRDLAGIFPVSVNTPHMASTAAALQAEVLLPEIIIGSGIKFAQMTLQR